MSSFATITWTFVPGSLSTLVEYREQGDPDWITPTSPTNPTTTNSYTLEIEDGVTYDVRLTTNGVACGPRSTTFQIFTSGGECCPPGYTLSDDSTFCFQINETASTPPSSPEPTVEQNNTNYGQFGTLIYDPGYDVSGFGPYTQISTGNAFWINGGSTLVDGPLNRSGLWATTIDNDQDVGFAVCITVPTTGTYYVGTGADNWSIIRLDGNTVVEMDPTAMAAYLNTHGFPGIGVDLAFKFWHIYPISLSAGDHVIEIIGHNVSSVAAMGAEIYNLTSAQIQAATSYVAMGSGLVFSTKDEIGEDVQVGSGGIGYTCPTDYSLVLCEGPAFCRQILTEATIPCTTTTTTTTTTTSTTSTTTSTTTTTTTTTNFSVQNALAGATIDDVTPVFYSVTGGAFPLSNGQSLVGTHGDETTISISVDTTTATGGTLTLLINGSPVDTIVVALSTETFDPQTFVTADNVVITLTP